MRTSVEIEGLREILQTLEKLPDVVAGKAMTRALLDGGVILRDEAKRRAPVLKDDHHLRSQRTTVAGRSVNVILNRQRGALKSGITSFPLAWNHVIVRVRNRGRYSKGKHWSGNPWYWWLVEFGTRHAPAQPFLRPAFEAKKHAAMEAIVRALRHPVDAFLRSKQRGRWKSGIWR